MTDDELETRLRDHGASWREANADRPAVDWEVVTAASRRRTWLAIASVAVVVAAAILVPLVLTLGGASTRAPRPAATPTPHVTATLSAGRAPAQVISIVASGLKAVSGQQAWHSQQTRTPVVSLGVAPDDQVAYTASEAPGCRTVIQSTFFPPPRAVASGVAFADADTSRTVATLGFGLGKTPTTSTPMAVSPDGHDLALVTTSMLDHATGKCVVAQRLIVLDLDTGRARAWAAPVQDAVRNLAWSADGEHLAFQLAQACLFLTFSDVLCGSGPHEGTKVLDTAASGGDLLTMPRILPLLPSHGRDGDVYGPVFWWHGQWVTAYDGAIRSLSENGGAGKVLASGLPRADEIGSLSSDISGDHLLLTDNVTAYRWDDGRLSQLGEIGREVGVQPGW